MRRVFRIDFRARGGGGKPTGVATDRLEDHVLVNFLHVARQNARLLDRQRDVTRGGAEAGRVVGREKVVVDRLRHADAAKIVTLFLAVLFDAMDGVHRVVAAGEEVVTNIVLLELFENDREIGVLNLVAATAQRAARRRFQPFDRRGVDRAKVENLVLHKAFDPVLHAEHFVNLRVRVFLTEFEAALNDAAKARINDARRAAALADNRVALKHMFSPNRLMV